MRAAGATVLSVDAARTLMLDGDAIIRAADSAGIAIVGRSVASSFSKWSSCFLKPPSARAISDATDGFSAMMRAFPMAQSARLLHHRPARAQRIHSRKFPVAPPTAPGFPPGFAPHFVPV